MTRAKVAIPTGVLLVTLAIVLVFMAWPAVARGHVVDLVSVNSDEVQADYEALDCAVNSNGRWVAFESDAANLGDGSGTLSLLGGAPSGPDIYLRDLVGGTTRLVTVDLDGTQSDHVCGHPSLSADGRYVAFDSQSEELVEGDSNGFGDVFVYDRTTGVITLVSAASDGTQGNGDSFYASISADGRYVAFWSNARNFVPGPFAPGDTNNASDIFLHDMQTGTTTRVSVSSAGAQGDADSYFPSISADGLFVAFASAATTLIASDGNGVDDVFVRDIAGGTTTRVSVSSAGLQGNQGSGYPSISGDGRYVAFSSEATNLVTGDSNDVTDIFIRDRTAGTTERVSLTDSEGQANSYCSSPSISTNGRRVAFTTDATNLVPGYTNPSGAVAVRDVGAGTTRLVSLAADGSEPNAVSRYPEISDDGRYVAFESHATNLVPNDTNNTADVFLSLAVAAPTVTAVDPAAGPTSGGTVVTISGTALIAASGVTFGGVAATTYTVDTPYRITATAPGHAAGTVAVQVTAGGCTSADSAGDDYTYQVVYTQLKGTDRYFTALLISQAVFPGTLPHDSGVVLAPGTTFQQALCGAPLAAAYGGPVLLTPTTGLHPNVRAELQRLQPDHVFVIGLSKTIADNVETALPAATVHLIGGATVYHMSRNVANALADRLGPLPAPPVGLVTIGTKFPDALALSPLACATLWPIILTDQTGWGTPLHAEAAATFADLGMTQMIKVGTYSAAPPGVTAITNLSGVAPAGLSHLARYYTNANVAAWAHANAGLRFAHTAFATGDKFPDALAAGPYLAKDGGILLLSPLNGPVPDVIAATLSAHAAEVWRVTFIACVEPVINQVKALLP